jgi:large subunit ribosomal protein L13
MRTTHVKASDVEERWLLFDASKHNLGRLAARIATSLQGKDRPTYTPSEHGATHIVVINSANSRLTAKKQSYKEYQYYTGYPGGRRTMTTDDMRERRPNDIVTLAVRRMLPKNKLGKKMLSHLKVYPGTEHPHGAQKPELVESL